MVFTSNVCILGSVSSILVAITNRNFNKNAIRHKQNFSQYFPTIIVDSGSTEQPDEFDVKMGNVFYTGLWNASVRQALERKAEWLLFVASDIEIEDYKTLCDRAQLATEDSGIGLYSPSIAEGSRCALGANFTQNSGGYREVKMLEGFFFLVRTSIVARQYPIDPKINKHGWGIDVITAEVSKNLGYKNVVDDQVSIFHPKSLVVDLKFKQQSEIQKCVYLPVFRRYGNTPPNKWTVNYVFYALHVFYFRICARCKKCLRGVFM